MTQSTSLVSGMAGPCCWAALTGELTAGSLKAAGDLRCLPRPLVKAFVVSPATCLTLYFHRGMPANCGAFLQDQVQVLSLFLNSALQNVCIAC